MQSVSGAPALVVQREDEVERLEALAAAAAAGLGAAVVVLGPAGIGKSTLLAAARGTAAAHGLTVLSAVGGELERDFAWGTVRQLLEPAVAGGETLFDGPAAAAAPVLGVAGRVVPLSSDPAGTVTHGLYWSVANLAARGPLLVTIDDLHWVDTASLRFAAYLARRVAELPVLLVCGTRPAAEAHAPELLERLVADPAVELLEPAALSEASVGELLSSELAGSAPPELGRACHRATGGNPLFVRAVARALTTAGTELDLAALPDAGSAAIARSVSLRLSSLGSAALGLARAVAVLGAAGELRHATALAGLSDAEAAAAADALTAVGILAGIRPLGFTHPILRSAVYREIPPAERARNHLEAARLLDAESAEPERMAPHLIATDPRGDQWVVDVLSRAAARSSEQGAPEAAIRSLQRALEEPPAADRRAMILTQLGGAELVAGANDGAIEHLAAALEHTADPRAAAKLALDLAAAQSNAGHYVDAVPTLDAAAERVRAQDAELAHRLDAYLIMAAGFDERTQPHWHERLDRLSGDLPCETPNDRLLLGAVATGRLLRGGSAADAVDPAARAIDGGLIAEQTGDSTLVLNTCVTLAAGGDFERCERALEEAFADVRARGSVMGFARLSFPAAMVKFQQGALPDAERHARDLVAIAGERGYLLVHLGHGLLVEALIEQGALEAAAADLPLDAALPDTFMHNWLLFGRGRLRLARAEFDGAITDLEELGRREDKWRGRNPAIFPYRSLLALAWQSRGEVERARALAREELELARAWGAPGPVGRALRGLAAVDEPSRAEALLRESLEVLGGSAYRLEHAKSLVELGSALRRGGKRADSREPLYEGMALAHGCGAAPVVERARTELIATGARPRRVIRTGADALTPSERRVAEMAATGMANREIAAALFITVRTVEVHLTHCYQKLDISSRAQLANALATE